MSEEKVKGKNPFVKKAPHKFVTLEDTNSIYNRIRRQMKKNAIKHGMQKENDKL